MKQALPTLLVTCLLALTSQLARAGSATWDLNPTNGDWNMAENWTPATVPNGASDTATSTSSMLTGVFTSADTTLSSVAFDPGAASFTITPNVGTSFTIGGAGVRMIQV